MNTLHWYLYEAVTSFRVFCLLVRNLDFVRSAGSHQYFGEREEPRSDKTETDTRP